MSEQICPKCQMTMSPTNINGTVCGPARWTCICGLSFPWAASLEASAAAFERLRDPLAGGEWPKCPECERPLSIWQGYDTLMWYADCTTSVCGVSFFSAPTFPALLAKLREPPKPKPPPCPEHPDTAPDGYGKRLWCPARGCNRTVEGGTFTETLAMWNAGVLAAKEKA